MTVTGEGSLKEVSPVQLYKSVNKVTAVKSLKKLKTGSVMIEVNNYEQYKKVLTITNINDSIRVKVESHKKLNQAKGIISSWDLQYTNVEELSSTLNISGLLKFTLYLGAVRDIRYQLPHTF